jgi:hypothetical protein
LLRFFREAADRYLHEQFGLPRPETLTVIGADRPVERAPVQHIRSVGSEEVVETLRGRSEPNQNGDVFPVIDRIFNEAVSAISSPVVAPGTVYLTGNPERVGSMPVRQDIPARASIASIWSDQVIVSKIDPPKPKPEAPPPPSRFDREDPL